MRLCGWAGSEAAGAATSGAAQEDAPGEAAPSQGHLAGERRRPASRAVSRLPATELMTDP